MFCASRFKTEWNIETLFGCLNGRGFKLEGTFMVSFLQIKKLLVLPVIAFSDHIKSVIGNTIVYRQSS
ncbi:MAG: hypothetical protein K0U68_03620 [Gammaproteobacteria bacterium]|nr:hypothetical protein [Gammaproteobacteria bacterium]